MAVYTINTSPSPKQPSRKPSADPKKKMLATAAGVLILVGGGIAAWMLWSDPLPPADAPALELIKFAATDRFAELPDEKKQVYVDAMMQNPAAMSAAARDASLSDDQRENAFMNAMSIRMNKRLDDWLKLDEAGKKKYAEDMVKEAARRASTRPTTRPGLLSRATGGALGGAGTTRGGPGGGMGARRNLTPQRQKRMIESMRPDRRAALPEMMSALRKAREAAGKK
jgi:hypothetical protein